MVRAANEASGGIPRADVLPLLLANSQGREIPTGDARRCCQPCRHYFDQYASRAPCTRTPADIPRVFQSTNLLSTINSLTCSSTDLQGQARLARCYVSRGRFMENLARARVLTTRTGITCLRLVTCFDIVTGMLIRSSQLNASDERGIDVVREQIKNFAGVRTFGRCVTEFETHSS